MKYHLRSLFLFFFLWGLLPTFSQSFSTLRKKVVVAEEMVIKVDSLVVLENSFAIDNLSDSLYDFDCVTAILTLKDSSLLNRSLSCSYRIFNPKLKIFYSHKSTNNIYPYSAIYKPKFVEISPFVDTEAGSSVITSGSISRGFSVGNNVDFGLTSSLNLQLSGLLAPDLKISANITDKNVPIQPEGNTRTIQDFDRVFINLNYKDQLILDAGDIVLHSPENYFLKMNKKILGFSLFSNQKINNKFNLKNRVGGGISKGKFFRQRLTVINGIQGPYRLTGPYTNAALIILSGSEKVYVDNKLLTRGADADYVIDYNTGEITFTPNVLVTNEKEFNVEYEYSDNAYARYSLFSFNEWASIENPKLKLYANYFREQDLKNHSFFPELSNEMKLFLSQLAPNELPLFPNVDSVPYSVNEVLYESIDTIVNGLTYSIYQYSTQHATQLFRVGFLYVGENKGDYQLVNSSANGRVFVWIAPSNGIPQGNYNPVMLLNKPILSQMGVVGMQYDFAKYSGLALEAALSGYNANTFSNLKDELKIGYALKFNLYHKQPLKKRFEKQVWWFHTQLQGEFLNKNFSHFESFRNVEFYKDYNLNSDFATSHHELLINYLAGFQNDKVGKTEYKANYYSRLGLYRALKNELNSSTHINGFLFSTQTSFLSTADSLYNTTYIRSVNNLSQQFANLQLGAYERFEMNRYINAHSDTLMSNSFLYNEASLYIKNADSIKNQFYLGYTHILQQRPENLRFAKNESSHQAQLQFDIFKVKNSRFKGTVTYRNSQIQDSLGVMNPENYFIGSLDYSGRYLKNALILSTYYEAGSGMEQKKQFSFLKVLDGHGTHVWNDYNNNGVEEINEFEIAAFQDQANYVKVWIASNDFINTYNTQFTQKIQFRPANLWRHKKGFLKFLSRFSNLASLRIAQKNTLLPIFKALNPFNFNIKDSNVVSNNLNFINTLSFNQNSSIWGIDYTYKVLQNKVLNFYGSEASSTIYHDFLCRVKPINPLLLKFNYIYDCSKRLSSAFQINNFTIVSHTAMVSMLINHSKPIDWSVQYLFSWQNNLIGEEKNLKNSVRFDLNYRMARRGVIGVRLQYLNLKFLGDENMNVAYQMLEGFRKGHNLSWYINMQTNLSEFLQLDLKYEGRVSQHSKIIHLGMLQVKAHF